MFPTHYNDYKYKYNVHMEGNIYRSGSSMDLNWLFRNLYSNSDFCFYHFYSYSSQGHSFTTFTKETGHSVTA